jgi:AraC-like DNA-binding protein
LCADETTAWFRSRSLATGVELGQARITERGFDPHRHDTYAIGITDFGAQVFGYRGKTEVSTPGQVIVLHPDELHDGRAGDGRGLEYRIVYVCPMLLRQVIEAHTGCRRTLPFVSQAASENHTILQAVARAFSDEATSMSSDALLTELAAGILELEQGGRKVATMPRVDTGAIEKAQEFLNSELSRPVRSDEIEAITGLSRFEFSRQFRACHATSPYRYSLYRRLAAVRNKLETGMSIAAAASQHGFADQSHLTRHFHSTYGVTPQRYKTLVSQSFE